MKHIKTTENTMLNMNVFEDKNYILKQIKTQGNIILLINLLEGKH